MIFMKRSHTLLFVIGIAGIAVLMAEQAAPDQREDESAALALAEEPLPQTSFVEPTPEQGTAADGFAEDEDLADWNDADQMGQPMIVPTPDNGGVDMAAGPDLNPVPDMAEDMVQE